MRISIWYVGVCLLTAVQPGCRGTERPKAAPQSRAAARDPNGFTLPPGAVMRLGHPLDGDRFVAVAFYPDGTALASDTSLGEIQVWDVSSGRCKLRVGGHGDWGSAAAFFLESARPLAAESFDGAIRILDLKDGSVVSRFRVRDADGLHYLIPMVFAPDGETIVYEQSSRTVASRNVRALRTAGEFQLPDKHTHVNSLVFKPDGKQLACAAGWGQSILLFGVIGHRLEQKLILDPRYLSAPESPTLLSGTEVNSLCFSEDGYRLASGEALALRVWDTRTGVKLWEVEPDAAVYSVAFSPDGGIMASGVGRHIVFWKALDGTELFTLNVHGGEIRSLAFSAEGNRLASASEDGTILVWDMERLTEMWAREPGGSLIWELPGIAEQRREIEAGDTE